MPTKIERSYMEQSYRRPEGLTWGVPFIRGVPLIFDEKQETHAMLDAFNGCHADVERRLVIHERSVSGDVHAREKA